MATLLEQEQARLQRARKAAEAKKAAGLNERKKSLYARKTREAIRLERKNLLGEAFMQAHEAERLTPQHMSLINDLLLALPESDRGKNWDVMGVFLLAAKSKPKIVSELEDAAE